MAEKSKHSNTADNDATYNHIVKYIGLFGGVQGLNMLISIIRNKVTAAILGPAGIGLISIYNKVTNLIGQATNFGISFSAVKHVAELSESADIQQRNKLIDTVRIWCMLTALLGLLVGLILSPWISWWTFRNFDYTHTFCLLSLIVPMVTVTGGEIAILKGLKQLKKVAIISIFAALATLLTCTPIYYLTGIKGIAGALVISNAIVLWIHLHYSSQVAPWRKTIATFNAVKAGIPMVKLGIAYILAGILGQGADYIIISFIQNNGNAEWVGLYNTGYFLAVSIGSMLFVAVEADFFPRLSAMANDVKRANVTINRQIEACSLLITPFLIAEVIAMPLMVRILYTAEFSQATPMAVYATLYLFFKALILPVAYLPLAKGDSKIYLCTEFLYDAFIAVAIPFAFARYGLSGAGLALSLASLFDLIVVYACCGIKYKFRLALRPIQNYLIQFALLSICICAMSFGNPYLKWMVHISTLIISAALSYKALSRETDILKNFAEKVRNKLTKP